MNWTLFATDLPPIGQPILMIWMKGFNLHIASGVNKRRGFGTTIITELGELEERDHNELLSHGCWVLLREVVCDANPTNFSRGRSIKLPFTGGVINDATLPAIYSEPPRGFQEYPKNQLDEEF